MVHVNDNTTSTKNMNTKLNVIPGIVYNVYAIQIFSTDMHCIQHVLLRKCELVNNDQFGRDETIYLWVRIRQGMKNMTNSKGYRFVCTSSCVRRKCKSYTSYTQWMNRKWRTNQQKRWQIIVVAVCTRILMFNHQLQSNWNYHNSKFIGPNLIHPSANRFGIQLIRSINCL